MCERYEYYKKHCICVRCGQEDAVKNRTLCLVCVMKSRESALNYNKKHKEELREKNRIKSKNRYNKLKTQEICTSCGKRAPQNNKVLCEHCTPRTNNRKREKYLLYVYATKNMSEIRV